MLDSLAEFFAQNLAWAPYLIFGTLLLAGLNIPISIDIILVLTAWLAGRLHPASPWPFFISFLLGCQISAWLAYWLGRTLGRKLQKWRLFSKVLSDESVGKMENYFNRYGMWTLFIGRFIPFGVRNCIYMSSGLSKMSFTRFVVTDAFACSIWSAIFFFSFYHLSQNYHILFQHLKRVNLIIFGAFIVTLIPLIWYKLAKKK